MMGLLVPIVAPAVSGKQSYMDILTSLGLTSNLQICLDAGAVASLPAASTKWLDLSGNGYDFFRGTTAGVDTTDPTINGTAGELSDAEYLSFDGGDYLRYDSANETWMENLHKNNAIWSYCTWVYVSTVGTANSVLWGTGRLSATQRGVNSHVQVNAKLSVLVGNGSGGAALSRISAADVPTGQWNFLAVSIDETNNVDGAKLVINEIEESFAAAYTTPTSSAAAAVMEIGAAGAGTSPVKANYRMSGFMMWTRALSFAEFNSIYEATKGRFGL